MGIIVNLSAKSYSIAMALMNVSLPDGLKAWAEARVAEGRYSSSDYVRDLMRRDQENEKWRALHAAIDQGLASPETSTTVQDIMSEFRAR